MNRLHAAFLIALTGTLASAGSLAPALFARNRSFGDGKLLRLPITRVHIDARIVGRVAETTLTLTFSNPHDRELEGELYFPLPEGVTVSGYALDIRGTMVDGVAVAKRKARQVYEAIVAQKIDPGLVEWVKANTFRTRVYPLPAHGARTVSISTVAELANKGEGMAYRLPLAFPEAIADVSVRVRVDAATAPPRVTGGATANMVVGKASHGYVVYAMERDIALDHDLVVVVPDAAKGQVVAETAPDGDVYFCITDTARDPRPAGNKESRARPRRIAVLWDASRSREKVDHEKEFALIERYVASLGAGKLLADLVVFRDSAEKARRFRLDDGTAKPLIAALQTVVYDGGTQLGRLAAPGADVVLLFTDGLATYGAASPPVFRVPVYAFNVASVADPAAVRRLAQASGGEFFDLTVTAPDAAVAGMGETPFQFLGAKTEGVAAEDSFPRTVERVQGRFAFTGRLRGDSATVTLTYGANGKPLAKTTHVVRRADAAPGTLLARLWAQEKVAHLLGTDEGSQAAVEDVGKRYGIVTPYTSLIVLESLEQYIQYGIEPPRTLPGMREAYAAAVGRRGSRAKKNEADRLAEVAALWRARVSWWEREFPQAADFRHRGRHVTDHDEREEPWGEEREENLDHWGEEDDDAPRDTLDEDFFGDEDDDGTPESVEYGGGRRRTALAADGGYSSVGSRTATTALGEDFFGDEDGDDAANAPPEAGQVVDGADKAEPVITIKQWDPNVPYLAALKKAAPGDMYRAYLAQRTEHGASPGYYVDCADALFAAKQDALALRVLSNVAELRIEDEALLLPLGQKLAELGQFEASAMLLEKVVALRPEWPQSHRSLALVLARHADAVRKDDPARAKELYDRAIRLLVHAIMMPRDGFDDFFGDEGDEIEVTVLTELNALIPRARAAGLEAIDLDARLVKLLDLDLRIVLTWDTDDTDMDLWVIEPSGEKAYYGHNRTTIGGRLSRDLTDGHGPEEYTVRRAMKGKYTIRAKYYGASPAKLLGPVTLRADVFTHYGRPDQTRRVLTFRLEQRKGVVTIGEVEF